MAAKACKRQQHENNQAADHVALAPCFRGSAGHATNSSSAFVASCTHLRSFRRGGSAEERDEMKTTDRWSEMRFKCASECIRKWISLVAFPQDRYR